MHKLLIILIEIFNIAEPIFVSCNTSRSECLLILLAYRFQRNIAFKMITLWLYGEKFSLNQIKQFHDVLVIGDRLLLWSSDEGSLAFIILC